MTTSPSPRSEVASAAKAAIDRYGTSAGAVAWSRAKNRCIVIWSRHWPPSWPPGRDRLRLRPCHNVTTIGHCSDRRSDPPRHSGHNSIVQGASLPALRVAPLPITTGRPRRPVVRSAPPLSPRADRHRGVYSMDGDFPNCRASWNSGRSTRHFCWSMSALAGHHGATAGASASTGRGPLRRRPVDGTLSKSLASCGGYIAGSTELVEYLKYTAPGFVYSVGLPRQRRCGLAA